MSEYIIELCHIVHTLYSCLEDGGAIMGVTVIILHKFHFASSGDE